MRESTTEKDVAAELQLSVPAEKLSEVFDALARLGEERRRQVSTEDVAEEVGDVETDLTTTSPCANRLRTLVRQAKEVKDVLAVEQELTRVQASIDRFQGRLKRLRENIASSAIDLQLTPKATELKRRILGPLGYLYVGTKWLVTGVPNGNSVPTCLTSSRSSTGTQARPNRRASPRNRWRSARLQARRWSAPRSFARWNAAKSTSAR